MQCNLRSPQSDRLMKNFLQKNYHWLLLGFAVILSLATAAFLITQSLGLHDSFTGLSSATKSTKSPAPEPSANSTEARSILRKPFSWKAREDGASPLVSRPYLLKEGKLTDPLDKNEPPLYPPVPNQWLIDHQLDYTDVNILDRDPKHKGFTVKEEFEAGTDPNDPNQFPSLCYKLRYSDSDINRNTYTLEFIDVDETDGKKEFELRPLRPLPNPAKGNRPDLSSRAVALGDTVPGAPFLKVTGYQDKKKSINDTDYDVSELTLENTLTGEHHILTKKYTARDYKPHPIELIESVTFHYQLTGAAEELITVQRSKEFSLSNLDKKFTETYRLNDFTNEGILLGKDGKTFTIKPSAPIPLQVPVQ